MLQGLVEDLFPLPKGRRGSEEQLSPGCLAPICLQEHAALHKEGLRTTEPKGGRTNYPLTCCETELGYRGADLSYLLGCPVP